MTTSTSKSWEIIRLLPGMKYQLETSAFSRAMFVVKGEIETVAGYRKGLTVTGGEMTLVHAVRSRTVRAVKESLVVVCNFEDIRTFDHNSLLSNAIVGALSDAGAVRYGSDIEEILTQVRVLMDAKVMDGRLDGFLRNRLTYLLADIVVTTPNIRQMLSFAAPFFRAAYSPACNKSLKQE